MTLLQRRVPRNHMISCHVKWQIFCKGRVIMGYCSVSQTTALSLASMIIWKLFQAFLETLKHLWYM